MKFDQRDFGDQFQSNARRGNRDNNSRRFGGNNEEKFRQQPKKQVDVNSRGYGNRNFRFEQSDLQEADVPAKEEKMDKNIEDARYVLDNFLEEYENVLSERGNQVPVTIQDMFWEVAEVMTHYYENRYHPLVGRMNAVMDIMASARFANSLRMVLSEEEVEGWCDGVRDVWKKVMFALSTVITCCHGKMKDEVLSTYIDLIGSDGMAGKDIDRLITENAITKDLALDLVVSIPSIPSDMTDATLDQFYGMFLDKLLKHAEENVSCMDRVTQSKLFTFLFGKEKIALKAIGKMIGSKSIGVFENNSQELIYGEYVTMLFERLDSFDIGDILFVLRYIVKIKQTLNPDTKIVFDRIKIAEHESIGKAYLRLIAEDSNAKKVFVNA